ncbi:unknown [Tannerella sp. CAG:118]|uniref:Uncharacterized protein n=2 Tax=Coprobacter secundus TaxID=1501392 RepID=A0A7G1HUI3_9BACT|nr:hypothetical protein Cop2CBH44_17620 [Coprobacter secundus subsp. similis]CCY36524.1 unknown [Tannerella sp. CAG:118]
MNSVFRIFVILLFCLSFTMFHCVNTWAYEVDEEQYLEAGLQGSQTEASGKKLMVLLGSFATYLLTVDNINIQPSDTDKEISGSDVIFFSDREKFDLNIFYNRYAKVSSAYRQVPLFAQRYQSHYYVYGLKKIVI